MLDQWRAPPLLSPSRLSKLLLMRMVRDELKVSKSFLEGFQLIKRDGPMARKGEFRQIEGRVR